MPESFRIACSNEIHRYQVRAKIPFDPNIILYDVRIKKSNNCLPVYFNKSDNCRSMQEMRKSKDSYHNIFYLPA